MVLDTHRDDAGTTGPGEYAVRCGAAPTSAWVCDDVAMIRTTTSSPPGVAATYDADARGIPGVDVQVEVTTSAEALEAIDAGARFIMCDNMSVELPRDGRRDPRNGESVEVEATGGLTLEVAAAYAATGVDYPRSVGWTHSSPILDIALDLEE